MIKNLHIPLVDLKAQYKSIKKEVDLSIKSVIDRTDFIMGEDIGKFEIAFAKFLNVKYSVGISSGTDAIHLALRALGVGRSDEVILPSHTFTACAEPIIWLGAKPVFADIDESSYTIDPNKIKKLITRKTKAIIPVHLYGYPANMKSIMTLSNLFAIPVIEDCAQAHGAEVKFNQLSNKEIKNKSWKKVGSIGVMGCFSFYPGKNLGAYGDAGMVVTNNEKLAHAIKLLRNHGRIDKYTHEIIGFGNRLDTIQAAVLIVKLRRLKSWNNARRNHAIYYSNKLKNIRGLVLPVDLDNARSVYHLYVVRAIKRDKLRIYLKSKGIDTGIHYPIPLHLQPAYKFLGYKYGDFPNTEKIVNEIISLPMYPELTTVQIDFICKCIKDFYS